MNLTLLFFSSFVIALSGALSPGPLLTLTILNSLKKGFWQGTLIILGHAILEVSLIFLILKTGHSLFNSVMVKKIIFFLGGIILVAVATGLIFQNSKADLTANPQSRTFPAIITGIVGSLSNPYWLIWWITIGLGLLIQASEYRIKGIAVFFSGHILADFLWYSTVSFSFSHGRKFIKPKFYKAIIFSCSFFLLVLACWFLTKSFLI
ncbi:MAG: LysE family transporter [Elusimicrobia bacterium]|nr:LysE family transporter [Elusimicrobiota bacterium]